MISYTNQTRNGLKSHGNGLKWKMPKTADVSQHWPFLSCHMEKLKSNAKIRKTRNIANAPGFLLLGRFRVDVLVQ